MAFSSRMSYTNHNLSQIFMDMSNIYRYLGAAERFRSTAYAKAAQSIDGLKEDVTTYLSQQTTEDIPGIGESIAEKIGEYVKTGKIRKYEELKRKVPLELLELMNVSGFGPQTLKQIHRELKISTKEALIKAIEDGRISRLKGFGPKKVENMKRGLKLQKQASERMPLWKAMQIGERIVNQLRVLEEIREIELAGSIRRGKETIGDIDILIACDPAHRRKVIEFFTRVPDVKVVLAKGETKASILIKERNVQVDLRVINDQEWGAALLYFTGSKEHNIYLRTLAREKGLKISEYGVFDASSQKRLAGKNEKEIYDLFGLQFIPPELREMRDEFELAAKRKIPRLIELEDIKGDMQMHSTWSDGSMDIEPLARFVMKNYPYEFIVLTDHSKSSRIAHGMDEREFLKEIREIERINKKLGKNYILKGVEVDILADGSLDLKDDLLRKMDWVCASIHSGFTKDNTERLVKACQHPLVHCIGHPTGRLIGKREPYKADWEEVFKAAAKAGTAMEINAQPDRMDLKDELARQAVEAGVKLTISTDSHTAAQFAFMKLGVLVARRAGCKKGNVLELIVGKRL